MEISPRDAGTRGQDVDRARIRAMVQDSASLDPTAAPIATVSEFVSRIRQTLEATIPLGWISGEVSSQTRAASGHLYFTIKDERAQIRCTMWRNRAQLLPFQLCEGMRVELLAQVTVYEARGDLQLSVENVRKAGAGSLYEAFLRTRAKLEQEGLFESARKRPLPTLPLSIGVVTSPGGAALHDVATTLQRRAPAITLVIYPTPVQGDGAGAQIAAAVLTASARAAQDRLDALIVCRGGGSLEDLWAFNQEAVVRAVAACSVPVVSGVGHETDTTLCDLAADMRTATPTAAAEILSAAWQTLSARLPVLAFSLKRSMTRRIGSAQQHVDDMQRRLIHPAARLQLGHEKLIILARRLGTAISARLTLSSLRLATIETRLKSRRPNLAALNARLDALHPALQRAVHAYLERTSAHLAHLSSQLTHLNPDAILLRGYAIVRDDQGRLVRDAARLNQGDLLDIQLATGSTRARVEDSHDTPAAT